MSHTRATGSEISATSRDAPRLTPLDGLRGLAALVVVIHHAVLTWQVLANHYLAANPASGTWWLTFTPLHLAWAGTEAVTVFFVLSGMVLVLPFLDRRTCAARWRGYYGRRLIRLYVPVVVAVLLAALLVTLFPRVPGPTTSWWFDLHAVGVDRATLVSDALVVGPASRLNTVLWSLKYEVYFSLLLPLYVVVAQRLRGRVLLPALALLGLTGLGTYTESQALTWLPVFGIGVCLAVSRARLMGFASRIEAMRHASLAWTVLWSATVVLLLAEWWGRALHPATPSVLAVTRPAVVAGAALVCVLVMNCPAARRICDWRPVRWLGLVSFSLYLVHEPIVVSVSSLVGGSRRGVVVTVVVGTAVSLAVAALFYRLVELPSRRLAAAAGQALGGGRVRSTPPRHDLGQRHGGRLLPPVPPPRRRIGGPVDDRPRMAGAPAPDTAHQPPVAAGQVSA